MPAIDTYSTSDIGTVRGIDNRSLSEKYGKMSAPFFRIEISNSSNRSIFSGESLARDGGYDLNGLIISDVEWDENDCESDMLSFTVYNPDLKVQNTNYFVEGNNIDLWIGYDGHQPDYMGRSIISEIEISFVSDGMSTLRVVAYDISYFLMEEGRSEIIPEGTAYWERRTVTVGNRGERSASTPDQIENEVARIEGELRQARVSSDRPGNVQNSTQNIRESTGTQTTPETRLAWRQRRKPRQKRKSGKVWRNKTDSEIVTAIFNSYGIVSYLDSIASPRRRTVTQTTTRVTDNAISDTTREARARDIIGEGPGRVISVDDQGQSIDLARTPVTFSVRQTQEPQETQTTPIGERRVVQKSGTTDLAFIKKLAKTRGFITFIFFHYESKRWIGYWGNQNNVPQWISYDFFYNNGDNTTLKSVTPRISTRGQSTEIDMTFVDPRSNKQQKIRISLNNISRYSPEFRSSEGSVRLDDPIGDGPEVILTIHGQRTRVVANRNFTDMEDAKRWLMAFWLRHATDFCLVDGETIVGLPEMRARQKHTIQGIGRYGGMYFITKCTHRLIVGQMYTVSFSGYKVTENISLEENDALAVTSTRISEALEESADEVVNRWRTSLPL